MLPQSACEKVEKRFAFSIRTVLWLTAIVAGIFGANDFLGPIFGWIAAIPLLLAVPLLVAIPTSLVGGALGFVVFAFLGEAYLVGWQKSDEQYLPALITVSCFGVPVGTSIHGFCKKRWFIATIAAIGSIVTLYVILNSPI